MVGVRTTDPLIRSAAAWMSPRVTGIGLRGAGLAMTSGSRPSGAPRKQALCPEAMARIAFIGLGVMGGPMARHLGKAGHNVVVYNRTLERAQEWVRTHGGTYAATPA